jgi:hypothetical protein
LGDIIANPTGILIRSLQVSLLKGAKMARRRERFQISVDKQQKTIVLSGDLDDDEEVLLELEKLQELPRGGWTVDARNARPAPEGVVMWAMVVLEWLPSHDLVYKASHLAYVLDGDPDYEHKRSTFTPYPDDEPAGAAR